jgi:hypothetical protein
MSTAYTFDATIARAPARRASSSLVRRITESSQSIKTLAKIFLLSTAAVGVVAALFLIHIDNPTTNDRGCALTANLHNSLVHPGFPPLAVARDWHTDGLPILREPTVTAGMGASSCDLP